MDRNKIAYLRAFIKLRLMHVTLWTTKCTVSKKDDDEEENCVIFMSNQTISQLPSVKIFLYPLFKTKYFNKSLTVHFFSNCFRWNSWFVCLRWYKTLSINTNCLDLSNKVTGLVVFLATYFLFNMIKTRSNKKAICLSLSLLTRKTKGKFLITY